jgi:sulfonate transport system ATP-binding protein
MTQAPLVAVARNVSRTFVTPERSFTALDGVSVDIRAGEFVALVGKSGSGKTTFLRMLAGLDTPDGGEVRVADTRTLVFQEPRLVQSMKVWQNVALGLPRGGISKARARQALEVVGLEALENKWPATLSGGEAQRVALARALVRKPKLLLLDEPFGALDALTRLQMQDLVAQLCARYQPATLIVTHDVDEAILLADRVLVLRDGKFALSVEVPIKRPRPLGGPVFTALRAQLLQALGVHTDRAASEEIVT